MARTALVPALNTSLEVRPLCLFGVEGHNGRRNDALFKPALPLRQNSGSALRQQTLVFFGGDVQNFIHLMDQEDTNIQYQHWCLEKAASRLGEDFPSHHIVVIKPTRIVFDHISCFDNFVEGNFVGVPRHVYHYNGLPHMEKLLKNISNKIKQMHSEELFKMLLKRQEQEDFLDDDNTPDVVGQYELMSHEKRKCLLKWQKNLRLHKYPLTLVAFSKGCVVLNQFLYEFHYAKHLEPRNQDSSIIDRIETMYWLDGGHPGRTNVYLTSRALLKTLADLGIEVHLHVSLYQTEDAQRPWIRTQCQEFIEMLVALHASIIARRHVTRSTDIHAHFSVLVNFMRIESRPSRGIPFPPPSQPDPAPATPTPSGGSPSDSEQTPEERAVAHREILGVALISPHDSPYLGLQMILRRPLNMIYDCMEMSNSSSTSSCPFNYTAQNTSTSTTQNTSTSTTQNASNSTTQNTSNSASQNPSEGANTSTIPANTNFTVLMTKESCKINFNEDPDAARAYLAANYYQIEAPVIATPNARAAPGLNVYTPVDDIYIPLVFYRKAASAETLDSAAAATPRPMGAVVRPAAVTPPNNHREAIPTTILSHTASAPATPGALQSARTAQRTPGAVQSASTSQGSARAAQSASSSQGSVGAVQSTSTSQGTSRAVQTASTSQGTVRAVQSASTSNGTPWADQSPSTSQGTVRAVQSPSTSQGTVRAVRSASTSRGVRAVQSASISQCTTRSVKSASTSQSTARAVQSASTSQGTARDVPSASTTQGTARTRLSPFVLINEDATAPCSVNGRTASSRYNLRSKR